MSRGDRSYSVNLNVSNEETQQRSGNGAINACIDNKAIYILTAAFVLLATAMGVLIYFTVWDRKISGNILDSLSLNRRLIHSRRCPSYTMSVLDSIYRDMEKEMVSRGMEVVQGGFESCTQRGWKLNCVDDQGQVKGALEWELRAIANLMLYKDITTYAKEEIDVIIAHKKFNDINGIHYKNGKEYVLRYHNFRIHKKDIDEHNKNPNRNYNKGYSWTMEFSDQEAGSEMLKRAITRDMYDYTQGNFVDIKSQSDTLDTEYDEEIMVDWRTKNVLSPVIDQGTCGSCWAVAAASLIDAYYAIKTGTNVQHSPQQLLDCVSQEYTCLTGGNHEAALKHASKHGVCQLKNYPYTATKNKCREQECEDRYKIGGITKLNRLTLEEHIKNYGPALVTIRLSRDFMQYSNGIFDGSCESKLVHSVLIVGFGRNKKTNHKFWIVRNSWGTNWADGGYYKLSREPQGEFRKQDTFCYVNRHAFGIVPH